MTAVSLDVTWLRSLSSFQQIESIQEAMHNRLKLYFPSMYAFSYKLLKLILNIYLKSLYFK